MDGTNRKPLDDFAMSILEAPPALSFLKAFHMRHFTCHKTREKFF
jgi:hypothetical protein